MGHRSLHTARTVAVVALACAANALVTTPASASPLTFEGPHCGQTLSVVGTTVKLGCSTYVYGGTDPYTYNWTKSKNANLDSYTRWAAVLTCTDGALYRLDVVVRDAAGLSQENATGWLTCRAIIDE
jgi:hypothetical protein